ncbi:MAG: 23S rRNA (guanosine(2251)-2'-O)-methyltransferase RlmB [Deltaproteobacteria bacterium]|nr:MAG: 23S rRNA (guanosine(2251)-2'-O)-methyltransferase RlmB [Deltaproteobacteria bacterium]
MLDQIEGRNPVVEALARRRRRVVRIWVDERAGADPRLERIASLARQAGVQVQGKPRRALDEKAEGRVHNGVIAWAEPLPQLTVAQLIDRAFASGSPPFFLLCAELAYEHNLGAILRSALGFGAHGVIVPTRRGAALSPVVQRVAMGAAEEIPVVRESFHSAAKHLQRAGIPLVAADLGGQSIGEADLRGPIALVMGGEGAGLSSSQRGRCDRVVSIPLEGELESLNVSVAAAVLMYEKHRQDRAEPS